MRVWLNGEIMEEAEAHVSPFDRGFLYGDGVYEGIRFFNRVGVGMDLHVERLRKSLDAAKITGFDADDLRGICEALLDDAGTGDAMIFAQITRGVQIPRYHLPPKEIAPTVFAYATAAPGLEELGPPVERSCITVEDQRWKRCDIKCISLMANVLAIIEADLQGADEPIFQRQGMIGEGAMTNVFIATEGTLVTPPLDHDPSILHGTTRELVLQVAPEVVANVEVCPVTADELRGADEVMITSSRRLLDSVVRVDGQVIGDGNPVATRLLAKMKEHLAATSGIALHSP